MAQSYFPLEIIPGSNIVAWLGPHSTEGITPVELATLIRAFEAKLNAVNPPDGINLEYLYRALLRANEGSIDDEIVLSAELDAILHKIYLFQIQKTPENMIIHLRNLSSVNDDLLWTFNRYLVIHPDNPSYSFVRAYSTFKQARDMGINIRTWEDFLRQTAPRGGYKEKYLKYKQMYIALKAQYNFV